MSYDEAERDYATESKRMAEVPGEVEMLHKATETLEKNVSVLVERLRTVTRHADPIPSSEGSDRLSVPQVAASCELGNALRERRESIIRSNQRLSSLLEDLEV